MTPSPILRAGAAAIVRASRRNLPADGPSGGQPVGLVVGRLAACLVIVSMTVGASACAGTPSPAAPPETSSALGPPAPGEATAPGPTVVAAGTDPAAVAAGAWPAGKRFPLALPEDVAGREVLGWLDPARDPRIEWTRVVRREDLVQAWGAEPLVNAAVPGRAILTAPDLPPVLVAVLASTGGMSRQVEGAGGVVPNPCWGVTDDEREQVFAAFDAATGVVRIGEVVYPGLQPAIAAAAAIPAVSTEEAPAVLAAVPTPPSTPASPDDAAPKATSPEVPPDAVALSPESVPPALVGALRAWPLLPGNRWTWRVTTRAEGLHWSVTLVTETVAAGWVVGEDTALVRTQVEVTPVRGQAPPDVAAGEVWRYVTPRGVFASALTAGDPAILKNIGLLDAAGKPVADVPLEPGHTPLLGGRRDLTPSKVLNVKKGVTVKAGAGAFEGCTTHELAGGSGWASNWWVCPGTGRVRGEKRECIPAFGALTVYDLVASELEATVK
jgi:hypothetical protein